MADWDLRFMTLARHVGGWSKDRSRQVGCVVVGEDNIVRAIGFNGFPRGLDDEVAARHQRPAKYLWTEHAERNAIYAAARAGVSLSGTRMYVPWFPCVDCARAIVQAGIVELIAMEPDMDDPQWGEGFAVSIEMLTEAGIKVRYLDR
ncbi:dCMP deaminase family protein [Mesorhizobium sp. B2-4-6]|uniref:deoxycytidylate deaminase n=1 Tax=Mesorhizobium sp. B2-4-6 TaxID=2589943 RepID=UPI00112A31F8|nr:dCMP deaminase family protein [Mesorhizobium sp. B2-4-6]TPL38882.1 dCMP deaminase family protein [Mesorhizobium sp. B2-4-6]